jgi:predicted acyl esterase
MAAVEEDVLELGPSSLDTAPTRPPHLAAMFCAHSASNAYRDLYYAGGAIHMIMPTWLLTQREMVKPLCVFLSNVNADSSRR